MTPEFDLAGVDRQRSQRSHSRLAPLARYQKQDQDPEVNSAATDAFPEHFWRTASPPCLILAYADCFHSRPLREMRTAVQETSPVDEAGSDTMPSLPCR